MAGLATVRCRFLGVLAATLLLVLVAAGCGSPAGDPDAATTAAAPAPERPGPLDRALRLGRHRADAPGATAAVVTGGELIWTGASGQAVRGKRSMTPETLFPIASTTKTMVAAMVLRLAEQGRLDLDVPIGDAVPGLPGAGRITPRMLLRHRSGLGDYFADGAIDGIARRDPEHEWTRAEVLSHVYGLDFAPGSRYHYSNSGYVALGGVIEKATGAPVEDVFQREVAGPSAMQDSSFVYDAAREPEFAHPYRLDHRRRPVDIWPDDVVRSDYWGPVWTDGGLASTGADLARFGNAFVVGDLLDPSSRKEALQRRDGAYGLGIERFDGLGTKWFGHTGLYEGFEAENWTDPRSGTTVTALVNTVERGADTQATAARVWWRVARQALREAR